jgi:hypothetical protein
MMHRLVSRVPSAKISAYARWVAVNPVAVITMLFPSQFRHVILALNADCQ